MTGCCPSPVSLWERLDRLRAEGRRILFEGAQGMMLDVDLRNLPVRQSSKHGRGPGRHRRRRQGPGTLGFILGITKALHHPRRAPDRSRPSKENEIGRLLGERGREFGTVTGRARRWAGSMAVLVRQAVRPAASTAYALTKLDVLDGLDEIKVCTGYRLDGEEIRHLPAGTGKQARVEPVYETFQGWQESTQGARSGPSCRPARSSTFGGSRN